MTIERIESGLPTTTKIELLNNQIIEVNGKTEQAKFDKNELDQICLDLGVARQFTRDFGIGNTLSTYVNWTHLKTETGYSIWRYNIADYVYNANNQLYFDNALVEFAGLATSEIATQFDSVFIYASSVYSDVTAEASTEEGTEFSALVATADYIYLGANTTFGGATFEFQTRISGATFKVEYYNGAWTELSATTNNLVDNTANGASNGSIEWDIPVDWATTTVNAASRYWIRVSTTTVPSMAAEIYSIIPTDSVVGLLSLSSSQLLKEEWKWCSLGTTIYVTIRNAGNSAYEGDYFLTSSSTSARKQSFFIYNHLFKIDYENSAYALIESDVISGVLYGDLVTISGEYTFVAADADAFATRAIGIYDSPGQVTYMPGLVRNVNTAGNNDIVAGNVLYLSTSAGKVTKTAPVGGGKIAQKVGTAMGAENAGSVVDMIMHIDPYPAVL